MTANPSFRREEPSAAARRLGALALACTPVIAAAGVVDARAVEESLLALFAGFIGVVLAVCLALVAALAGPQRRRLVRRSVVILLSCSIAAMGYAWVVVESHNFARLEQAIVFLGTALTVIGTFLVVHAFIAGRAAGK